MLCVQNSPECLGHSLSQDPSREWLLCRVWEGGGTAGFFVWRIHSLFLLEPLYLFTSLLSADAVINNLALRCWQASKGGFHVCFRLTRLSLMGALFAPQCLCPVWCAVSALTVVRGSGVGAGSSTKSFPTVRSGQTFASSVYLLVHGVPVWAPRPLLVV